MSEKVSWSSVINRSFFYTEFRSYEIEQTLHGIILKGWEKSLTDAYSTGSLFLKPEWILHLINAIRSVPKDELEKGTDGSGYGEWKRHVSIPFDHENLHFCMRVSNKWYERSSPKLETSIYLYDEKKEEFVDFPFLKNNYTITLSHADGIDGYIEYVEPVLEELEKYVPEESKGKILEPVGKRKSEIENKFEHYLERIKESEEIIKEPDVEWINRQIDDTNYEVTLCIFYNKKIDGEKKIKCSTKAMAMMSKYFRLWNAFINTIPYEKENKIIKMTITQSPKYEGYSSVKFTIKESSDFFEVPFNAENPGISISKLSRYTDADRIHTNYLQGLHGFFQDEHLVLKWYSDEHKKFREDSSHLFFINRKHAASLCKAIKIDLPFYLSNPDLCKYKRCLEYDGFHIDLPYDLTSPVQDVSIVSKDRVSQNGSLSMECFPEDLVSEVLKAASVIEELVKNAPSFNFHKDLKNIRWKLGYEYNGEDSLFWLEWQSNQDKIHRIDLTKEKIFKIQEYALWWWRATDHSEKYGFSDDEITFEINPCTDIEGLGILSLKIINHKKDSIETYFDLNDGRNLPKDFCDFIYKNMIRKAKSIDSVEEFSKLFPDRDRKLFKEYRFISLWNSKYQNIGDSSRLNFVIKSKYLEDFKSVIKELYDYLCSPKNKVSDLLSKDLKEKYDREGFWISIYETRLAINCSTGIEVEEDIPLDIVIHSKEHNMGDYFSLPGTRHTLLKQLDILIKVL